MAEDATVYTGEQGGVRRPDIGALDQPRVLRPDCLLTESGFAISELDSVPGGIGLTAWLNQTYSKLGAPVIGGERGMMDGFSGIFGDAKRVHLVVSEEAGSYRPEMEWLAQQLNAERSTFNVQRSTFNAQRFERWTLDVERLTFWRFMGRDQVRKGNKKLPMIR